MSVYGDDRRALLSPFQPHWPDSSFLARLPSSGLDDLLDAGSVARFAPREVLIEEGARDSHVFLLLSSFVKVTASLGEHGHALLAVRVGGDIVGELSALDGERRSATVSVCGRDPVFVVRIPQMEFMSVLSSYPDALVLLSASVGRKLRSATRRRVDYSRFSPVVRIARVLAELADAYGLPLPTGGVVIGVDLTQLEMGTLVGVKESSVLRALAELRRQGLMDTGGRRFIVRRLDGLKAIAYGPESAK